MRKTDKKTERHIIRHLTDVCEAAKVECEGFIWLTHEVDYQRFPQSLRVILVFNESVTDEVMLAEFKTLVPHVQQALESVIGAVLPARQIEARREYHLH